MKKFLIFLIILFLAMIGTGLFFYSNFTIEPTDIIQQAAESMTAEQLAGYTQASTATFTMIDLVHQGRGEAAVYAHGDQAILRFENFSVTNGPDLFVYLSKEKNIQGLRPNLGEFISLGRLKSTAGEQTYVLPEDYQEYPSVVVWCRAFGVLFSVAEFSQPTP